ncbi:MAG: FtsX-like permease family protein [Acidobacteria bacterium]|nr:FtsX-like permease family protein [Acidobacteriota bacterium]
MTSSGSDPARVNGAAVSGSFFDLLGVSAAQGRTINAQDDEGGQRVVTISHGFWQARLGGRDDVLGRALTLDGMDFEVVGVLPEDFGVYHPNVPSPDVVGLFVPYQPTYGAEYASMSRGSHFLLGFARASNGVSPAQVQADMDNVALAMNETGNYDFDGWGLTSYRLHEDLVEDFQGALVILLGAVAFVLLIACLNVANLQLTRASQRGREIALRTAVGAARGRVLRQLLTEALVLAAAGAIAGLALASWLIAALQAVMPDGLPRAQEIGLDGTVLSFAAVATLATVALFGVLPGFLATRTNLADTLRDSGRTTSGGPGGGKIRSILVVAEVAAALVLLVGAGLMLRSFNSLVNTDPGYRTDSMLTMRVSLPTPKYDADTAQIFQAQLLERTRALPGVISAGGVSGLPLSNIAGSGTTLAEFSEAEDVDEFGGYKFIEADRRSVSPGYFEAMGVELLAGRFFDETDTADSMPVVIVDESFARRFWGEKNPIGQRASINFRNGMDGEGTVVTWSEVVGVIRHARTQDLAEDGREQFYAPWAQRVRLGMHVAIRTDGDPTQIAAAVNQAVWDLDPDQPVSDIATMSERVDAVVAGPRFVSVLLGSFAAAAVVLAAIGIYGVIAYSVGQRTNEIGVRMALGASKNRVRQMVLREGMVVVLLGVGLGVAAALGLTRLISNMLYEVTNTDPATYVGVVVLLVGVAITACLVPALRATRIEPVTALREE